MIVSSMTSIEPDVGQDWLYVHSPSVSALAGFAKSAKIKTGRNISHLDESMVLIVLRAFFAAHIHHRSQGND